MDRLAAWKDIPFGSIQDTHVPLGEKTPINCLRGSRISVTVGAHLRSFVWCGTLVRWQKAYSQHVPDHVDHCCNSRVVCYPSRGVAEAGMT